MKPIPVSAAEEIAKRYGYDQVVIIARKCGTGGGEHVTTYGRNRAHCDAAARIGHHLKFRVMGWPDTEAGGGRAGAAGAGVPPDPQAKRIIESRQSTPSTP